MRIGIMGGTFDPIHFGHLFIAEESRVRHNLDHVLFVPNGTPPHKKPYDITAPHHRYEMTIAAIAPNSHFKCSDIEMNRKGASYAIDTLRELTRLYPGSELVYVTGADAIADILTWRSHEEVINLAHFIAATRPGFDLNILSARLPEAYLSRITLIESVGLGISSTEIRTRLAHGMPVRYLIPDPVLEYIENNRLYNVASSETT